MEKISLLAGETKSLVDFIDARKASVTIEGTARVSDDGTEPNADCGHKITDNSLILLNRSEIKNFRVHAITDSSVQASYIQ